MPKPRRSGSSNWLPRKPVSNSKGQAPMAQLPVLYSFRRCPYAMRARLAIAASHIRCELREVLLRDKPQALRNASPKATVPVLVDTDGTVIEQSLDIMLWALQQRDPDGWLSPSQGTMAAMLALIGECDGPFKYQLDHYKYPQRYNETSGDAYRDQAAIWLMQLNARLEGSCSLFGDRPALADMAIAPFVRQFAHTDIGWFGSQSWPRLQAWLDAWLKGGLFERVMLKYPRWVDGGSGNSFPPAA